MKGIWGKIALVIAIFAAGWFGSNTFHAKRNLDNLQAIEDLKSIVNVRELALEQVRQQANAEIDTLRGMVTSSATIIAGLEEDKAALRETEEAQTAEIRELKTAEVVELLERYPALKLYDLAKDRLLETKDGLILNLTQSGSEKDRIIALKDREIAEQIKIGLTWKAQYEDQKILAQTIEKAFKEYRSKKGSGVLWFLGGFASGAASVIIF